MTSLVILSAFGGLLRSRPQQYSFPLPREIRLPVRQMLTMFRKDMRERLDPSAAPKPDMAIFTATPEFEVIGDGETAQIYELDFGSLKS